MMRNIVLATHNNGKLHEMQAILQQDAFQVVALSDFTSAVPAETGLSFIENAIVKARHAALHTGLPALADDSGLVVDALHGVPGIYSARYAGENAIDKTNIDKLLQTMSGITHRIARFVCVLAYVTRPDDPLPLICQGIWQGEILHAPQGKHGFGYDPIFYVPTHLCSAAELAPAVKNQMSHRAQALRKFRQQVHYWSITTYCSGVAPNHTQHSASLSHILA